MIRLSYLVNRGVEVLLATLGILMAFVVALQVFSRFILNDSLFWSEEIARYMLVWLAFLGATVGCYRGVHPGVDMLITRVKPKIKHFLTLVSHGVCALFYVVLLVSGINFSSFVKLQITPALGIPKWIIYSVVPVSALIMILHTTTAVYVLLKGGSDDR